MKASDPPIPDRLASRRGTDARIRVGIGGWTFPPWRKDFYPDGLPQRRELEYASRQLAAIEINGTYYGAQKPATYAKWRDETPRGFVFTLKAPRHIVEHDRLANAGGPIDRFITRGLAELGDRLGPVLWQFPPSRSFERDDFGAFLDLLPSELNGRPLRHVLEVRHPGFACADYLDLVGARKLPTVFTDSTTYPSFADLTGDFAYARLMRSEAHVPTGYDAQSLARWAERARMWSAGGDPDDLPHVRPHATAKPAPRDVFVFFISAAKQRNPAAAMRLQELVTG